jgi:hypothetical protein
MSKKEFDVAAGIFMDAFFKVHPRESLPKWFARYTTCGGKMDPNGTWVFSIMAIPTSSLRPGHTWEPDKRGGYSLISTDPATGVRSVIISATSTEADVVKLFEARIDCHTKAISVIYDADIDGIDQNTLLPMSQPRPA